MSDRETGPANKNSSSIHFPLSDSRPPGRHGYTLLRRQSAFVLFFVGLVFLVLAALVAQKDLLWAVLIFMIAIGLFAFGLRLWTYKAGSVGKSRPKSKGIK